MPCDVNVCDAHVRRAAGAVPRSTSAPGAQLGAQQPPAAGDPEHPVLVRADDNPDIVFQGWLEKKSRRGLPNMKPWKRRYFVIYKSTKDLRYYRGMVRFSSAAALRVSTALIIL
jgi:hypothetical protein